ncbi:MAG: glycosyltransferase family 2 protein [Ferrimonas sp.]
MRVTVLFTTYNSEAWLEKVFWGLVNQTHTNFEVIVADDGSNAATQALIERMQATTPLDITHVWHPDNGFQKCAILNKALLHVRTEYVIFTDGDCILRSDFVATHVQHARRGRYLSGSYYKLPMATSQAITQDDVQHQRCFDVAWLHRHGLPRRRGTLKLRVGARSAALLNRITTTQCNLKGANASAWLDDILAVNGFDERMQWGGLDREFGVRLINLGITPTHVRYNAICVHLDHARGYQDPQMVQANKALRIAVAKARIVQTPNGIAQLLASGYPAPESLALQKFKRC